MRWETGMKKHYELRAKNQENFSGSGISLDWVDGGFGVIEVAVRGLELDLEADVECGEIGYFPVGECPCAVLAIVADAEQEVDGMVMDFEGAGAWFEIERAQRGCLGFFSEDFGVEVGVGGGAVCGGVGDE